MRQIIVDENLLEEIVRRLVEAVDPDRIILFGSRARGDARPDSDVDILIIKHTDQPVYRRPIPAYQALSGLGVPKDIIWRTPAEVDDWSRVPTYVTTHALTQGKILYEKRSRPCHGPPRRAGNDSILAEIGLEHTPQPIAPPFICSKPPKKLSASLANDRSSEDTRVCRVICS